MSDLNIEEHVKAAKEAAKKHNKRVQSIRNARLSKADVKCIDDMISKGFMIQDALTESVMWGANCLSLEDIIEFTDALRKFESQFTEKKP